MSGSSVGAARFACDLVPRWYSVARDVQGGVVERLDGAGRPVRGEPKTALVQARTVFSLAHMHLATGDGRLLAAAREVYVFLDAHLRDGDGGYRFAVAADGKVLADPASRVRRTYDASFVLLALVTLRRAAPDAVAAERVEASWRFIDERLSDGGGGALFESDAMAEAGARPGDLRGQNPHMHMLEAVLQAFEMTGEPVWMRRASALVEVARRFLVDPGTGAVREFVGFDLAPAGGADGARREPGHQFEWAWLLHRFADFGGDGEARAMAAAMIDFGERFGLRDEGPMAGAPFDAIDAAGQIVENTHLLWPLTEAGKLYAARRLAAGVAGDAARARVIEAIIFARYFAADGRPVWVNQLDGEGQAIWPEALSRLLYHVALFVTEGARAELWPLAGATEDGKNQSEETLS